MSEVITETTTFAVKAYPNPAVIEFTVKVESDNTLDKIAVRVVDLFGRTVEVVKNVIPNSTLKLGRTYIPGVYFVEMTQGKKSKRLKLMKQSN